MSVPRTFSQRLSRAVRRADLIIHPTVSETASNVQLVYPAPLSSTVTLLNTTDCRTGRRGVPGAHCSGIPTPRAHCWWEGDFAPGIVNTTASGRIYARLVGGRGLGLLRGSIIGAERASVAPTYLGPSAGRKFIT